MPQDVVGQAVVPGLGSRVAGEDAEASHTIFLIDAVAHIRARPGEVSFPDLGRNISKADRAVKEHNLILDAVRSGEVALAAERAGEQVQRSRQDYRDAIERRLELDRG